MFQIDYVEFERHGAGSTSAHYFDLFVKLRSEQELLFRNIQKNEYSNLFNFIRSILVACSEDRDSIMIPHELSSYL